MQRDPYLQAMGITQWQRRERVAADVAPVSAKAEQQSPVEKDHVVALDSDVAIESGRRNDVDVISILEWDALEAHVNACTACELHSSRTNTVFGVGNRNADWMIIGEAPGADEDRQAEPFVGRAGKLLTAMIQALGFRREQVYIANILKCRPPGNRDPRPQEVLNCQHYLRRQIDLIQPKVILAVGRVAAQNLLNIDKPMKTMRGQRFHYEDTAIPLVVTYHPAYLLRSPLEKRKAWLDLKQARQIYSEHSNQGAL
jgi:DNA polymerase